ncbi:MAG: Spy/CpxP family protein refolding chaperone [Muribaculaceae bacterium]|nr:Spy/CpxP family protein refolding chaperone [Muribaculaceae bacterium]
MKRFLFFIIVSVWAVTATALDADNGSINERFYQAKVNELVYRLHISKEQLKKFEPIYRNYCEEMTALWAERKQPITPNTSTKAAAIEKRKMEMQQRAQGIRMKYIDKFATVLTPSQIDKFYDVESEIQRKLRERQQQAKGQ